jgi:sulfur relay (sulfurtransferase) DsrC/TusE family protein
MPFAAVHLPEKFRKSQPELYEQFVQNTNRFTSTFDLHETLKDLVQMRVKQNSTQQVTSRIGHSLFEEIPIKRNCKDAKVPENFCVCMKKQDEQLNTQVLKVRIDEFISCDTFLA